MTDHELLCKVVACIDPAVTRVHLVRRHGRTLLALPPRRDAAARALGLYQPQRPAARLLAGTLRALSRIAGHRWLPATSVSCQQEPLTPELTGVVPGSCGVLFGSPEHRVRRAIASYQNGDNWEVAKIACGPDGASLLESEALTLQRLSPCVTGVPPLLGWHRAAGVTMLRMPYLTGSPLRPGQTTEALQLITQWATGQALQPVQDFSEWPAILAALDSEPAGRPALQQLCQLQLLPVICHGDFARWNLLRRADGGISVLDWEWGHRDGLPGLDLVHYFLQDARLVERLQPHAAIHQTLRLLDSPACRDYLQKTGWPADPLLPVIASLAYKQGAGQQENREILHVACALASR